MDIKDIRLKQGMDRYEVRELSNGNLILMEEKFISWKFKHNWKCVCGNIVNNSWDVLRQMGYPKCSECKISTMIEDHKNTVNSIDGLKYIKTYFKGEVLPNGRIASYNYVSFSHSYCGDITVIRYGGIKKWGTKCMKCCGSYENSFAHHIEVELGLKLNDVWDFEKNTVNPYHISKNTNRTNRQNEDLRVWLKCTNKDYHDSYKISCNGYVASSKAGNNGCIFCNVRSSKTKIHPKDSFAQYHIDNTDKDFLEKYWDYEKNTLDPWKIVPSKRCKVWIKCQNEEINELNGLKKKDYHESYEINCIDFTGGKRCSYCHPKTKNTVHPYDSFGYYNFDKVMSWHPNNEMSPFRVGRCSGKKYKFICKKCGNIFDINITDICSNNSWCPQCAKSKGEDVIKSLLDINYIPYKQDKKYDELLGVNNGNLSYDFYLPGYNLLIEYQGEFHDGTANIQTQDGFEKQQEHDRRKREYAKKHGIRLLEIWYWDFDNIEEILNKEIIDSNKLI